RLPCSARSIDLFYYCFLRPPSSPLFPYTTLFRSRNRSCPEAQDRSDTEDDRSRHLSGAWPTAAAEGEARTREGTLLGPALLSKQDRKSTRLNSSHVKISYAVFCLKKKSHRQADME